MAQSDSTVLGLRSRMAGGAAPRDLVWQQPVRPGFRVGVDGIAESFPSWQPIAPGQVVCLADDGHHVVPSAPDRAATVIGVVSTAPALTLSGLRRSLRPAQ